jgi:hypothetical protein
MMTMRATAFVLCSASIALSACGEKTSGAARKADVPAFQGTTGAAAYAAGGWKAGDQAAWEQHLRTRMQGQNEYARVPSQP